MLTPAASPPERSTQVYSCRSWMLIPKGEAYHGTPLCSTSMEELVWFHVIISQVDRANIHWRSASLSTGLPDLRSQTPRSLRLHRGVELPTCQPMRFVPDYFFCVLCPSDLCLIPFVPKKTGHPSAQNQDLFNGYLACCPPCMSCDILDELMITGQGRAGLALPVMNDLSYDPDVHVSRWFQVYHTWW